MELRDLYVISGVAGMTGNELARKLISSGNTVIGFDNFFASSIKTVEDLLGDGRFCFYEYDLNSGEEMERVLDMVKGWKKEYKKLVYINCAAIVHTEYFYHIDKTLGQLWEVNLY